MLLIDSAAGIYIPQKFAETLRPEFKRNLEEEFRICLQGPEHPEYWDAWEHILQNFTFDMGDNTWILREDGDLWLERRDKKDG